MYRIGLIGDYDAQVTAHTAIPQAIRLAAEDLGAPVSFDWIPTPSLNQDFEERLSKVFAITA
ncbi:hypothetical protein D3C73_1304560 [compost metagenome]